jgi:AcrR family transcriptional regulator
MSNAAGGGLIWSRPEPGARRPRFSREQIAAVALEIADAEGFEAVSMRRIAADLGAATMTLYNYLRTKDDLLALMHDAIMAEVLVPADELPGEWRPALTMIAGRVRDALVRHPWATGSLQEAQFGPNAMRRFEQFLAAVDGMELTTADKFDLLGVINSYVFGNALISAESRQRARSAAASPESVAEIIAYATARLESGQFPHTAKLMAQQGQENAGPPMDEAGTARQFERGLDALLDGLTLRYGLST